MFLENSLGPVEKMLTPQGSLTIDGRADFYRGDNVLRFSKNVIHADFLLEPVVGLKNRKNRNA